MTTLRDAESDRIASAAAESGARVARGEDLWRWRMFDVRSNHGHLILDRRSPLPHAYINYYQELCRYTFTRTAKEVSGTQAY